MFLDHVPQSDRIQDSPAVILGGYAKWVQVHLEGGAVREEHYLLGNREDALAEGGAVDQAQRRIVNGYAVSTAGERVQKPEEE